MSSRSFSDIKQADWIRACKKLGFVINSSFGKGSHVLLSTKKLVPDIQSNTSNCIRGYITKNHNIDISQ
jgi:hypothetical protein